MNKSVVICSVRARPSWGSHQMSQRGSTKLSAVFEDHKVKASMGSFGIGYAIESDMGSQNVNDNEESLIEDLSKFSNEDIAARIESEDGSPLKQHSDIKSDCTTASSSTSNSLQHCEEDLKTALLDHGIEHPSLSLPDQDETGFEWLGSLADDNLVCSAVSNFDIDLFLDLLSMPTTFSGTVDGILKHTDYENALLEEQEMGFRQNLARNTGGVAPESQQAELESYSRADSHLVSLHTCNTAELAAPIIKSSRSARSKRTRTVSGWSSAGGILWQPWPENPSPTRSLQSSSSQVIDEIKNGAAPQYKGCTVGVMCNQEEGDSTSLPDFHVEIGFEGKPNGVNLRKVGSFESCLNDEDCIREEIASSSHGGGALQPRRCTHCLSQKTPQWRAGPMGAKTLCNACGVRYKSGRLYEEYRPAKSPTFLSCKHSNSHRKVMDMRRRKAFRCTQQQQMQHTPLLHRLQASPMMQTHAGDRPTIGNSKARLHNPAPMAPVEFARFSDITLIRTRNAFENPSNFLY